jgi:hypothetical protein
MPVISLTLQNADIGQDLVLMTHVVNTKVVEGPGNLNLLLGIEESVGELLALTQSTLDNLETGDIAQEVGHTDVVAVRVAGSRGVRVLAGLDTSEAFVVSYRMIKG